MKLFPLILSAALACTITQAQSEAIYKYYDKNGNLVFTDEPVTGAEPLELPKVTTIPAMPVPKSTPPEPKPQPFSYQSIAISAPQHEENFINNQGTFTVTVALEPALRRSDQVQLYFNGQPQGEPKALTSFSFTNMDRGSYTVEAEVLTKDGKPMGRSGSVTFFVRRATINRP